MADQAAMDLAAEKAADELREGDVHAMSAGELAAWWNGHYLKAGHKRLWRIVRDAFQLKRGTSNEG